MPVPERWAKSVTEDMGFDGPTHNSSVSANGWWNLFTDARRPRRKRWSTPAVVAMATFVLVAIVIVDWLVLRPDDHQSTEHRSSTAAASMGSKDSAPDNRILHLLPSGYAPNSCAPAAPPNGVIAKVACGPGSVPGGPASASFSLVRDNAALVATFDDLLRHLDVVTCPGNIQSPGSWHTATQQHTGTLVCGLQDSVPTLAWTNDGELLLSIVQTDPRSATLDQLYRWWSTQR
jgi:hypothetical protein